MGELTSRSVNDGSWWGSAIALTGALAVLVGLGTWQLQRRAWKDDLLATIERRSVLPPARVLPLAECRSDAGLADPCEFRPVAVDASFDHDTERHVFISVPLQRDGVGGPGYWVFANAHLAGGVSIFVNRGFVPESAKPPSARPSGQLEGVVPVTGVLRRAEVRGTFSGTNDRIRNIYFVRAPREFSAPSTTMLTIRDYYIDLVSPVPAGGLPRPLVGKIAIPNRHLEYALTWYALAATLLTVALFYRRSRLAVNAG